MAIAGWEWGIAFVVAGGSLMGGFIGNILAGIVMEIEKIERKDKDDSKNYSDYTKMFFRYGAICMIVTVALIIFGFYLVNLP